MANEDKPSQPPFSSEDNRKPEHLQNVRKILKQPLIVLGTFAFVGVVVLIYYLFASQWTPWLLFLLVPTGVLLLFLLIQAGYATQWTGFRGKSLWSWMDLFIKLIGAFAIPLTVIGLILSVAQFNAQQKANAQMQVTQVAASAQMQVTQVAASAAQALDQQRQITLDTYLDRMSDLIFTDHLDTSKPGDKVRALAEARTYAAVRNLDGARKGTLVRFLWEAQLINGPKPIISLFNADLRGAIFTNADLRGANFSGAKLNGAIFTEADLAGAIFTNADLTGAHLSRAKLNAGIVPGGSFCAVPPCSPAEEKQPADLSGADLSGADLSDAKVTDEQLKKTKSLQGATMPDGKIHP